MRFVTPLFALTLYCLLPGGAHAQLFGSGIVFDPTQSAHAITQIENEGRSLANQAQQIENGQQIFTNTVKIASTAVQTYNTVQQQLNLYRQMMVAPQSLYARFESPMSDLMLVQQVSNTYGNSAAWVTSANTGAGAAVAYQQAAVPHTVQEIPGFAESSIAGQQQIAAQGATIDLSDSVQIYNLAALGTLRANQLARQTDLANLESASHSQDSSQLTVMAELQRINQALLLQLRTMQDANQINGNLALEQIVMQKQLQDGLKAAFQDASNYPANYQIHVAPAYAGAAAGLMF
jgi:hypothetical protein